MADRISRRRILGFGAAAIVGSVGLNARQGKAATPEYGAGSTSAKTPQQRRLYWEKSYSGGPVDVKPLSPGLPGNDYKPVVIPNGATLPFKIVDSVKVFHLIAEEMDHAFDSGLHAKCWGFNGRVNGTVIEAVEGERVRIYVTNRLSVATSMHWHGFYLPNGMDGVGGLTQPYIKPGETGKYEWILRQHGTLMFHSHHDEMTQMGMGMIGMFVIHPRNPATEYHVDRDFALLLSEWTIEAGTARPNTLKMNDFNILTINGKVFPSTAPLVSKTGDKVRIRLGNLGAMNHHPFHIHGHHFRITATDGGDISPFAQWPESGMLVRLHEGRAQRLILERTPRLGRTMQHKLPRAHIPQVVGTRMKSQYLPRATFPAAREPRRTRNQLSNLQPRLSGKRWQPRRTAWGRAGVPAQCRSLARTTSAPSCRHSSTQDRRLRFPADLR